MWSNFTAAHAVFFLITNMPNMLRKDSLQANLTAVNRTGIYSFLISPQWKELYVPTPVHVLTLIKL